VIAGAATLMGLTWQTLLVRDPLPRGVARQEYDLASEAFELRYGHAANRMDTLSWLAESFLARDRLPEAVECFAEIPTSYPDYGRMARYQQGRSLLSLHRAVEAEQQFCELISVEEASPTIKPQYLIDARQRLRHILEVELRFEERKQLLRGPVSRGEADFFEVVAYCFPSHLRWNGPEAVKWLEEFHSADPANRWINIALGRYRTGQGKLEEARRVLEDVVRVHPDDRRAVAALIACLREADDPDELARRIGSLPPLSADDPWLLLVQRGQFANDHGRAEEAIAAFNELLKHDRTSTEAWAGLSQAFLVLNDQVRRKQALAMSSVLGRIQNNLGKIFRLPKDPESYLYVLDLCTEIDLVEEGWILAQFVGQLAPDNPKVVAVREEFRLRFANRRSEPQEK
jgi:tetratricopeptide (TPR) repeat protein